MTQICASFVNTVEARDGAVKMNMQPDGKYPSGKFRVKLSFIQIVLFSSKINCV